MFTLGSGAPVLSRYNTRAEGSSNCYRLLPAGLRTFELERFGSDHSGGYIPMAWNPASTKCTSAVTALERSDAR